MTILETPRGDDFDRRRTVAVAGDHARRLLESHIEAQLVVEADDAVSLLIGEHDRAVVPCQPYGEAFLLGPTEGLFAVLRELDVVGRVSVDEVSGFEFE